MTRQPFFLVKTLKRIAQTFVLFLFLTSSGGGVGAVARFGIKSVSTRSVVIEMIDAHNVSRFDMRVLIYDLEKLREFRRSELTGARYNAQLFSFDGLIPGNWFAFRIEYRLVYAAGKRGRSPGDSSAGSSGNNNKYQHATDLSTKQELVVRTRQEARPGSIASASSEASSTSDIQDELIKFERVQLFPDLHRMNVTLTPVLKHRERVSTLVVAELRCLRGTVKPQAQQVPDKGTVLSFDLKRVQPGPLSQRNVLARLQCLDLCIFPFIRVQPPPAAATAAGENDGTGEEEESSRKQRHTFRAREICESLQVPEPPGAGMPEARWPTAADEQQQQKLLDRHFRSPNSATGRIFFDWKRIMISVLTAIISTLLLTSFCFRLSH